MNFLEGVQRFRQECGASGSGPASVVGQKGEMLRFVSWYQTACEEIESKYFDWQFLWASGPLSLVADQSVYLPAVLPSDLNIFDTDSFRLDGALLDKAIAYETLSGDLATQSSKPVSVITRPDGGLIIDPAPDQSYTLTFDYFRVPKALVNNNDAPNIPERYHRVILGRAMMLYANFESAPEIKAQGEEMYAVALRQLESSQLAGYAQTYGRSEHDEITVVPE